MLGLGRIGLAIKLLFFLVTFVSSTVSVALPELTLSKLDPDSLSILSGDARRVRLTLAAGDIEPLVVAISADQGVNDLSIRPISKEITLYPGPTVDIRWLIPWYQGGGPTRSIKHILKEDKHARDLVYELLVKDAAFIKNNVVAKTSEIKLRGGQYVAIEDMQGVAGHRYIDAKKYPIIDADKLSSTKLKANTQAIAWITVDVPVVSRADNYTKKFGIYVGDSLLPVETITIEINVLPITLKDSDIEHSIFYRGQLTKQSFFSGISSDLKSSTQLEKELKNMMDHGVTSPTIYQDVKDRSLFSRHIALRESVGIDNHNLYYAGPSHKIADTIKKQSELLRTINKIADTVQSKIYMFAIDEAKDEKLTEQRETWAFIRQHGADVFATGRKGRSSTLGEHIDLHVSAYEPEAAEAASYHSHNGRVFVYAFPQAGVEDGSAYRFNYGFKLWQADYDGAMTYAYQAAMGSNVWNDFDSTQYRDHVFAYPTIDGLIDTRQWESYREATDDLRYLATLNVMLSDNYSRRNEDLYREAVAWQRGARKSNNLVPSQARDIIIAFLERMIAAGWRYE